MVEAARGGCCVSGSGESGEPFGGLLVTCARLAASCVSATAAMPNAEVAGGGTVAGVGVVMRLCTFGGGGGSMVAA